MKKIEGAVGSQATEYLAMTDLATWIPAFPESSTHVRSAPVVSLTMGGYVALVGMVGHMCRLAENWKSCESRLFDLNLHGESVAP